MNTRVLVIGGGGRLGRALSALGAEPLLRGDADVTWPPPRLAEVLWERSLPGSSRPCFVVNAAALTDVSRCELEPHVSREVNASGAGRVAAACAGARLPLVHVSTDYVFGGGFGGPYAPEAAPCPSTVYGRHKAEAEGFVLEHGGWVARMSFLPAPFEHARAFSGVLANREWVEGAAARLLRLIRAISLRPRGVPRVVHAVPRRAVDLADLVRSRFPEVPSVPVEEGAAGLPFAYPRDTRLSGAWSSEW